GWQFAPDPSDAGAGLGWPTGEAGDTWRPARVPGVFEARPLKSGFDGTVGWYRLTFRGPATGAGMGWALRFEQVRRTADVWLNGVEIGSHRDPYTPFELPATGLRPGVANTLVVRVDNRKGREPREGWWNWGGISRAVSLVPRGPVVLEHSALLPRRRCADGRCRWSVLVDGWLENRSDGVRRPAVAVQLRGGDGSVSRRSSGTRALRPGERVRLRFSVPVRGEPELWSPEDPQMYAASVTTRLGASAVQIDRHRLGLRRVDVRDGMLRVNGRVLDLRGASIQEDVKGRGPALTDADVERTVAELKALGANVTRAHYLLDERLLDRFDEEGILVWSQAPVYHRDELLESAGGRAYELGVLRDTILAARSHPSVITHSVANELSPTPDEDRGTGRWLADAAALARDLDPTLPVSVDLLSYPRIAHQRAYDAYDMLGINSYYGWYEGKAERSTANLGDLAAYLRAMHAKYPRKALVMTEFGAEATDPGPADLKQTFAFQRRYLERNLEIVDRLGFMGGAIYWTVREFAVKPGWDGGAHPEVRDPIHNKGLIAYDGARKPAWKAAQAAFRATPLYRDDPRAVQRAQLSTSTSLLGSTALVGGVLALVLALLALDAWCLRDIWRSLRRDPPEAEVLTLRRVA
nr:beta galactosidase jelly roll domain-containing protein [Solirubrobacterales bacterium]